MADDDRPRRGPPRWIAVLGLILVVLVLVRVFGAGSAPEAGVVKGRVVHADGSPAPGALVEAIFEVEGTNIPKTIRAGPTPADGAFDLAGVPPRWKGLKLLASKWPLGVEMDLGDAPGPLDLALRLPGKFTVAGLVVSAEMGHPLTRMDVRLGERWTRTDSLGRFAMRDLPVSMLDKPLPPLEVSGASRKPLKRDLAGGGERLDDLLLRLERGP